MIELIYIILAVILGICAGTITGLLPGIHINLVASSILAVSAFLLGHFSIYAVLAFIIAMTMTHTFIDFIPSVFLGAPDEDSALAVLPGHEMLLKGQGYEAVVLTLYGSLIAIFLIVVLTPIFIFILSKIYFYLSFVIVFLLISSSIFLIFKEKTSKLLAFMVFMLAGFLGLASLNLNVSNSLLPLLSGLFGASSIVISIKKKNKIPKQQTSFKKIKISKKEIINSSLASLVSAPLCSILPSLGSGQAAVIGSEVSGNLTRREFLILLGIINTFIAGLSFIVLYSIGKARTGISLAIQELVPNFNFNLLFFILLIASISGIISFFLGMQIAKSISRYLGKLNYKILSIFILGFLTGIVIFFSGILGFGIFITSTFLGIFAILSGIRRTHLMGSLMIPSILLLL